MSLLLSITGNVSGGEAGAPTVKPTIQLIIAKPTEIIVSLSNYGSGDTIFYIDSDPLFESAVTVNGVSGVGTFTNQGAGVWYIRGKNTSEGALFSDSIQVTAEATQLRSLFITANEGDGQITITHDLLVDEPNIETVFILRRNASVPDSIFTLYDTIVETTAPYVDSSVTNGQTYEYIFQMIAANADYSDSFSNTASATPTASTPTLTAPNTLSVTWDEVTGGSGTFAFVDGSNGNADEFEVNIKATSTGISVASTTLTSPTVSYAFSGLTVGVSYTFEVYATATGFNNSSTSSIVRTAIDPSAETILPETFGIEGFYIPLDGSYTRGAQQPLIRYTPLDESSFNALSTGLVFSDYADGVTLITPTNNSNVPVTGQFSGKDLVGKSFCGIRARLNPNAPNASPWPNGDVSTRYSNVIWKDDDKFIVNLNYNGGNIDSPAITTNGQGYVFSDESENMEALTAAVEDVASGNVVDFSAFDYATTGKTIVCPTWTGMDIPSAKSVKIYTNSASIQVRIKVGYEDYYRVTNGAGSLVDGDVLSIKNALFRFVDYTGEFVTHNILFIPQHTQYLTADGGGNMAVLCSGTQKGGSIAAFVNTYSWKVKEELEAGYGMGSANYFIMRSGQLLCANDESSLTGSGAIQDVSNFGFTFFKGANFEGQSCLASYTSGQLAGSTYSVIDDFTALFTPESNYAIASNEFNIKFKTDKSWIEIAGDTDYLPSHCIEITDASSSWFPVLVMGGANRHLIIHVDRYIFLGNFVRYNQINGNYNRYYKGSSTPIATDKEGRGTRTAKTTLVDWEIVTEKESNGIDAKVICLSRDFLTRERLSFQNNFEAGLNVGLPMENAIRSHINWPLMLDDFGINISADTFALNYINEFDRKPKMWQNLDQFKLCAWVEVDDTTGLSVGDTITGNVSGNTASIAYIDNYRYTRRLILRGATGSFETDTTITNGSVTPSVSDSSTFNPLTVYTISRMQRGQYGSDLQNNVFQVDNVTGLANGQTLTGATSGASGTITSISGTQIVVRSTTNTQFQAGETFTTSAAVIQNTQPYIDENGKVYKYTIGGEYLSGAKWGGSGNTETSYAYMYYILDQSIDRFAYGSEYDPMLYVEVVTSNAEELLDGVPRLARHTYREGNGSLPNNTQLFTFSTKTRGDTNGHSATDLPFYMADPWPSIGATVGHMFYTPAEITRFWRNGNVNFGELRLNASSVTKTALYGISKGYTIANVAGIEAGENGEWDSPQASSSARQFETARLIAVANPEYQPDVSGYAANEGMTYPPKYILAGTNKLDDIGTWDDVNSNPTGENVIRQDEIPNLPTTCQNLLDSLPQ